MAIGCICDAAGCIDDELGDSASAWCDGVDADGGCELAGLPCGAFEMRMGGAADGGSGGVER
jgi:hypothetical protein